MRLVGNFVMISVESRESNGKWYHNVNMEADDGKLLRVGAEPDVLNKLQKYQKHIGQFEVGSYKGEMFMRLVDADQVNAGK